MKSNFSWFGGKEMRVNITLACTETGERNYISTKNIHYIVKQNNKCIKTKLLSNIDKSFVFILVEHFKSSFQISKNNWAIGKCIGTKHPFRSPQLEYAVS